MYGHQYFTLGDKHKWVCSNLAMAASSLSLIRLRAYGMTDSKDASAMETAESLVLESFRLTRDYEKAGDEYKYYSELVEARTCRVSAVTTRVNEFKNKQEKLQLRLKQKNVGEEGTTLIENLLRDNHKYKVRWEERLIEPTKDVKVFSALRERARCRKEELKVKEHKLCEEEGMWFSVAEVVAGAVDQPVVAQLQMDSEGKDSKFVLLGQSVASLLLEENKNTDDAEELKLPEDNLCKQEIMSFDVVNQLPMEYCDDEFELLGESEDGNSDDWEMVGLMP
eukprot:GHVS01068245.1.p1 GENE.GHVS01068245.1~~GHVS01068245.1.p1  ORF type:complete len:323 (+),score=49.36 GHVS01068245.1:131-970(+)